MSNISKPIRKPNILAHDFGVEMFLYSAEDKAIHILNSTARRIWELCNGEHSVETMAQVITASFCMADRSDVTGDIQRMLKVFASKRLLDVSD